MQNLGDFPILTEILPDDYNAIREASKRRPRNEVARFILSDLDKAYEYMLPTAPVSNRLNKDCAALVKSRAALFEATWENIIKEVHLFLVVPDGLVLQWIIKRFQL